MTVRTAIGSTTLLTIVISMKRISIIPLLSSHMQLSLDAQDKFPISFILFPLDSVMFRIQVTKAADAMFDDTDGKYYVGNTTFNDFLAQFIFLALKSTILSPL